MVLHKFFTRAFFAMLSCPLAFCAQQSSLEFVLAPKSGAVASKKMSLNSLKEEIGKYTKKMFESATSLATHVGIVHCSLSSAQSYCIDRCDETFIKKVAQTGVIYNQSLGSMQQELASIQKKCSSVVEKLIDNDAPFKKASKKNLETSLSILTTLHHRLFTMTMTFKSLNDELKKITNVTGDDVCKNLQATVKTVQRQQKILSDVHTTFNRDECLRQCS